MATLWSQGNAPLLLFLFGRCNTCVQIPSEQLRREVVQAGSVEGQDWMYATRPLCMLMEKDSALPTASTQTQERPWPDATRLAETGKVAILN